MLLLVDLAVCANSNRQQSGFDWPTSVPEAVLQQLQSKRRDVTLLGRATSAILAGPLSEPISLHLLPRMGPICQSLDMHHPNLERL